jgi:hypothetical protein
MKRIYQILIILTGGLFMLALPAFSLPSSGQNGSAQIVFDLNYTTAGNQGVLQIPGPGVGQNVYVEVRVIGAVNLASFEVDIHYPKDDLTYNNVYEDNAFSSEDNILNTTGSVLGVIKSDDPVNGVLNFAMASTDPNNAAACPDGDGLLALLRFVTKVASPGYLSFGDVTWVGHDDVADECSEGNKGGDASLPVQIAQFTAAASKEAGITLFWQTQSELDCAGFHILRSETADGNYLRVTTEMISGQGNSSSLHEYEFNDRNVADGVTYWYKIEEITTKGESCLFGPISVIGMNPIPTEFTLSENYPNPFNPETRFDYQLPENTQVQITVYDILGKRVKVLFDDDQEAGYYHISWDGTNHSGISVASGVYMVRISTQKNHMVRKVSLMR